MGVFIALVLIAGVVLLFLAEKKRNEKMKMKMESIGAKHCMGGFHMEGLPIPPGATVTLYACDDKILIESDSLKFDIHNNKILHIGAFNEQELIQANKSVVGRAIIGGVLLGGLGAIVGGVSGTGTKQKKGKMKYYLVINYTNTNGEVAVISVENNFINMKDTARKFEMIAGVDKNKSISL